MQCLVGRPEPDCLGSCLGHVLLGELIHLHPSVSYLKNGDAINIYLVRL